MNLLERQSENSGSVSRTVRLSLTQAIKELLWKLLAILTCSDHT